MNKSRAGVVFAIAVIGIAAQPPMPAAGVPMYEVDASWPKMEGNWMFGSIGGLTVDPTNDHLWVLQRPRTLAKDETSATENPPVGDCCVPAKPVMEFDAAGNYIQGWGGPGPGYEWPENEHGITIDYKDNFWIGGNKGEFVDGPAGIVDTQVLKFTRTGKFIMQIGHAHTSAGSNDTENLNKPTKMFVYPKTNEVFISDGYGNRRVIVFDADTGKYKRHWGAYGKTPDDTEKLVRFQNERPQFNIVHAVLISNDDVVYVSDRNNNRIQVFKPDGTFVREVFIEKDLHSPTGTAMDMVFSPDSRQQFLYITSGDQHVRILDRQTLQTVGMFGRLGHYPGQFLHLHVLAIDSKSNVYTGENTGKRVQKWIYKGMSTGSAR